MNETTQKINMRDKFISKAFFIFFFHSYIIFYIKTNGIGRGDSCTPEEYMEEKHNKKRYTGIIYICIYVQ